MKNVKKSIPLARLAEAATMRRSSLYVWMLANHDAFADVVKKAVRPNWEALAGEFARAGLTDGEHKAPSDECTRQTWWRVRKAVKARHVAARLKRSSGGAEHPALPVNAPRDFVDDDDHAFGGVALPASFTPIGAKD